jgi:predicted aspartyl protease
MIRVDTGYDGFLLLSEEKYKSTGFYLFELPRRYWPEGETLTGEIFRLRRALAIVQIPKLGIRLEGYVDTFHGNVEDLVGLKLIESLKLLLDGPAQLACIIH